MSVAEGHGCSPAEVAIAWLLARPQVSSVVLGARDAAQLAANLPAVDVVLTAGETALLDRVSDPGPVDYPYGAFGEEQRSRTI